MPLTSEQMSCAHASLQEVSFVEAKVGLYRMRRGDTRKCSATINPVPSRAVAH